MLEAPHEKVVSLDFSPVGKLLAASSDDPRGGRATIWDWDSGEVIWSVAASYPIVKFSPVGDLLAVGTGSNLVGRNGTAALYDFRQNRVVATFPKSGGRLDFSADGQRLATGSWDDQIKMWDVRTGQLIQSITNAPTVISIAFSPDGKFLATTHWDREERILGAQIWDLATGRLRTVLKGHRAKVWDVAFLPTANSSRPAARTNPSAFGVRKPSANARRCGATAVKSGPWPSPRAPSW